MSSNTTTSLAVQSAETDAGLEGRPQLENAQVHSGVTRVTISSGVEETTHQGTTRITADDLRGDFKGDILSTARTRSQMPARELTPETLVDVGGMQITLRDAEANGFVRRDDQGRYQEVSKSERQQAQQKEQPKQSPDDIQPEQFTPEVEQELADITKDVPGQVLGAVAVEAAMQAINGMDINPEHIASRTGMSPEQAARVLALAGPGFQQQADRFIDKAGANPQQFYEWARANHPQQLDSAVSQLVGGARSVAGFAPLVDTFIRSTTPTLESLKQARYETRIDPTTKEPMVKLDGYGWVSVKVASWLKLV